MTRIESMCCFGEEREFGILGYSRKAQERLAPGLLSRCQANYHTLPGPNGFFWEWGRFYIDAGHHPEGCTCECFNPWDLIYNLKVIEDILAREAQACEFQLIRTNVDYLGHTWGCHENYQSTRPQASAYARQIMPHLVSRIIYTGSGGLDYKHMDNAWFTLSPRVRHLTGVNGPKQRTIIDTCIRREPDRRCSIHINHGDSLFSQTALFLKYATTALILKLIEAGLLSRPPVDFLENSELQVFNDFTATLDLTRTVRLAGGAHDSALGIQRRYLDIVRAHLHSEHLPPWAGYACQLWQETLDLLAAGPLAVSDRLDWAIKLNLMRNFTGCDLTGCAVIDPQIATRLKEIDIRFGLVADGHFDRLDRNGLLNHRLPGVPPVAPPYLRANRGRPALRAQIIQMSEHHDIQFCSWNTIEKKSGIVINLGNTASETAQCSRHPQWETETILNRLSQRFS